MSDAVFETLPVSWSELSRRTWREALDDDILGLAAQLAYYLFLALFPAILFLLALASFFPLSNITDDVARAIGPFVSPQVLELIQDQMRRLGEGDSGGLLTFGVAGALWSSSAAMVSIVGALNKAYDIEEARPWWKVRLVSIGLTVGASLFVLVAFSLVLIGPTLAAWLGDTTGWGRTFEWTWLVLQWPLVFALVATAIGLVYYFAPDAEQDWSWITPGAVVATMLWLVVSLLFKVYIANFTDYNATYGAVGGVIVLLLWFYVSSLAILVGAELNAEIEHASPYGKAPGQKNAQGKLLLGRRAERAFRDQPRRPLATPTPASPTIHDRKPSPALGALVVGGILLNRLWHRKRGRDPHPLAPAPSGSRNR
jgi:membrane protein